MRERLKDEKNRYTRLDLVMYTSTFRLYPSVSDQNDGIIVEDACGLEDWAVCSIVQQR